MSLTELLVTLKLSYGTALRSKLSKDAMNLTQLREFCAGNSCLSHVKTHINGHDNRQRKDIEDDVIAVMLSAQELFMMHVAGMDSKDINTFARKYELALPAKPTKVQVRDAALDALDEEVMGDMTMQDLKDMIDKYQLTDNTGQLISKQTGGPTSRYKKDIAAEVLAALLADPKLPRPHVKLNSQNIPPALSSMKSAPEESPSPSPGLSHRSPTTTKQEPATTFTIKQDPSTLTINVQLKNADEKKPAKDESSPYMRFFILVMLCLIVYWAFAYVRAASVRFLL